MEGLNRFIILGTSRCGSTFLVSLLQNHPNIKVFGELFNLESLHHDQLHEVIENPIRYLKNKIYINYPLKIKAVGFKIFYYHAKKQSVIFNRSDLFDKSCKDMKNKILRFHNYLKHSGFDLNFIGTKLEKVWEQLRNDKELLVVHLKRRNMLKTYLSKTLAFITNEWTKTNNKNKKDTNPVKLNYEDVLEFFQKNEEFEKKYDQFFRNHNKINVYYEDLIKDRVSTINSIFKFLSVPPIKIIETKLQKQNRLPLSKAIFNYSELKDKFKDTLYIKFFQE